MRYVIVGASAAGLSAAQAILELNPGADLLLVDRERRAPYARPLISYWLSGDAEDENVCLPGNIVDSLDIRAGRRAVSLEPAAGKLELDDGDSITWDKLLIATGADSKKVEVKGEDAAGVFGFRSWDDAEAIGKAIDKGAKRAVVLGGGLIGVKAALALSKRGVDTSLCISSAHPLSQNIGPEAGRLAVEALEKEGVKVLTGHVAQEITSGPCGVTGVRFSAPDAEIPCNIVIRGKGVCPCGELVGANDPGGSILVDMTMATSFPNVWAAGDVARCHDRVRQEAFTNAIWPVAVEQGRIAGLNMVGANEKYEGSFARNSVRIGKTHFISAGLLGKPGEDLEIFTRIGKNYLRQTVLREGILVGFTSVEKANTGPTNAGLAVNAVGAGFRMSDLCFDPLSPKAHAGSSTLNYMSKDQ